MKKILWVVFLFLVPAVPSAKTVYKPLTLREPPLYLSTDENQVEDTCPQHDIFSQFFCTKETPEGFSCFDVYRVEGDPVDKDRYTLLDETLAVLNTTAEPACNFEGELTCHNFLASLNYNLDFSWFITNFPSSSFPQCNQTYTCTRIACWQPITEGGNEDVQSKKLLCVFKKNQIYFLGNQITCHNKKTYKKAVRK